MPSTQQGPRSLPDSSWPWEGLAHEAVFLQDGCEQKALLAWRLVWQVPPSRGYPPSDQLPRAGAAEVPPSQCSNPVINRPEGPHNQLFFFLLNQSVLFLAYKNAKILFCYLHTHTHTLWGLPW